MYELLAIGACLFVLICILERLGRINSLLIELLYQISQEIRRRDKGL